MREACTDSGVNNGDGHSKHPGLRGPGIVRTLYQSAILLILLALYAILTPTLFKSAHLPFDSDEATHALAGLQLASDMYHGEAIAFLRHVYFIGWYPPLLPTYLSMMLLAFGPTIWGARYAVLLLSTICAALLYRVSLTLTGQRRAGLAALLLATTSPFVWMHSLLCMEEMLSLVGVLLTILTYSRSERGKSRAFWVGISVAATLLARLFTGICSAAAVLITILLNSGTRAARIKQAKQIFIPLAVICLLWWGHPAKARGFLEYAQASPPAYTALTWQEISYYSTAMMTTYTLSPLIGVLVLASIVTACFHWREPDWRLPLSIVVVTWLALLIKRQLNTRFFASAVYAAFLLTGNSLVVWERAFKSARVSVVRRILSFAVLIQVLIFLVARVRSFPFLMEVAYETDAATASVYTWVNETVANDAPIFLINGWDQLSTQTLDFHTGAERWPQWSGPTVTDVLLADPQEDPLAVGRFQQAVAGSPRSYLIHLTNTPVPNAGAWWAYETALEPYWNGEWQSANSYWVLLWDGKLENEIFSRPLHYVNQENRLSARRKYGYPLLIEARIATCRGENN